jgi:hypothetical protein
MVIFAAVGAFTVNNNLFDVRNSMMPAKSAAV